MDNSDIAKQLGKAGGNKTLQRHGTQHFKDMIAKRWRDKKANQVRQELVLDK